MATEGVRAGRPARHVRDAYCSAECPACGKDVPRPECVIREAPGTRRPQTEYVRDCGGVVITIDPTEPDDSVRS